MFAQSASHGIGGDPLKWGYACTLTAGSVLPVSRKGSIYMVDGSGTINRLTPLPKGAVVDLHFNAAPTLVHSTLLLLPGSANVTVDAGSVARFISLGNGVWRCAALDTTYTGAALTKTDDTNVTLTLGGSPTTALLNAASITVGWSGTLAPSRGGTGISSLGTGVATALGVNVGSAGAPVINGGALGTPSSATLTNATGLPISTGVSGLGTGVAAFLATPSSANLAAAVTDETGSGALVFGTSPTFTTQITSPSVIGGTGASSTLTLLATTGVGAGSEHVYIKGGSNGAITLADFSSSQSYFYGLVTTQGGSAGLGFADRLTTGATYHYRQSGIFAIYDTAYSGGANMLTMNTSTGDATFAGNVQAPNLYMSNASFIARSKATLTNAAAAATGTLTNAPAAGNPTKWIAIDDNGTTRYIPAW